MAIAAEGSGRFFAARHRSAMIARALFSLVLSLSILSSACSRQDTSSDQEAELLWSYFVSDALPTLHKFGKLPLRVLFVVDEDQAHRFAYATKHLLEDLSIKVPLKFEPCFAAPQHSADALQFWEESCASGAFDLYFIISSIAWSDVEWRQIGAVLSGPFSDLFNKNLDARALSVKAKDKWFCHSKFELSPESGDIIGGLSILETQNDKELSTCVAVALLASVGIFPFDGEHPLGNELASDTVAHFILKDSPYGAAYLVKRLYADELKSGMSYTDAVRYLRDKE